MKNLFYILMALSLAACSGGGGGSVSTPSTSVAQVIKAPQLNCGGKDCLSGATVASSSLTLKASDVSSLAVNSYDDFKSAYANMKLQLQSVKEVVNVLNGVANEEDLASCDDIPTSGSFNWNNWQFTFDVGTESFDIGNGLVTLTKKVVMEQTATGNYKAEVQLACSGNVQSLHIIGTSRDAVSSVKTRFETYSQIDTVTGAISLQAGSIVANSPVDRLIGYFSTSGGADFEVGIFANQSGGYVSSIGKTYDGNNWSDTKLEYVTSRTSGENLDTLAFGVDVGAVGNDRQCVFDYKTTPSFYTSSCDPNDPTAKNSLVSIQGNLLGLSGSPAWNTSYTDQLDITDLLP